MSRGRSASSLSLPALRYRFLRTTFPTPLYALTLAGSIRDAPSVVPPDPWPGDPLRGDAIRAGRFEFAGHTVTSASPPWVVADNDIHPPYWRRALHEFTWLRDLRALGGDEARQVARTLTLAWIDRHQQWSWPAWRADTIALRIVAWLTHYDVFFASADDSFRRSLMTSIGRQIRHLARILPVEVDGAARLTALKGLICGAVSLPCPNVVEDNALALLKRELSRQIFPDGGHVERNPTLQLRVLCDLIDIRATLNAGRRELPESLQHAIDRLAPMLRFFRHGDRALAHFNGSNEGDVRLVDLALSQADARGRAPRSAPHTGFERLSAGRMLVLVDVGCAAPGLDQTACAGTLSFEASVGRDRLIVNCGAAAEGDHQWQRACRTTAAHSTAQMDNRNSSEIRDDGAIGRRPSTVVCNREDEDGSSLLSMSHDGYLAPLSIIHERQLYLAADGEDLRGEDKFAGPAGHPFTIRFHLHPRVQASLSKDSHQTLLRLPGGSGWRLRAEIGHMRLEESIYLETPNRPRRSQQIVVDGVTANETTAVKWELQRHDHRSTRDRK